LVPLGFKARISSRESGHDVQNAGKLNGLRQPLHLDSEENARNNHLQAKGPELSFDTLATFEEVKQFISRLIRRCVEDDDHLPLRTGPPTVWEHLERTRTKDWPTTRSAVRSRDQ